MESLKALMDEQSTHSPFIGYVLFLEAALIFIPLFYVFVCEIRMLFKINNISVLEKTYRRAKAAMALSVCMLTVFVVTNGGMGNFIDIFYDLALTTFGVFVFQFVVKPAYEQNKSRLGF